MHTHLVAGQVLKDPGVDAQHQHHRQIAPRIPVGQPRVVSDTYNASVPRVTARVPPHNLGEQTLEQVSAAFAPIATKFGMNFSLRALPWNPRTAILVSKTVHCLSDLLTRSRYGDLGLDVAAVISKHNDSRELVEAFGYRYEHIPVEEGKRAEQE